MPLMPLPPKKRAPVAPVMMPSDYHTFAFQYLMTEYSDQIRAALIQTGPQLRKSKLRRRVRGERVSNHLESWDLLRPYLDDIEEAIASIIGRRSRAYWMHLYRRIAPVLSSEHDGKTDPLTAVLVRKISDQAIVKYGSERFDDLVPISKTSPKTLLGGYFARGVSAVGPDAPDVMFKLFSDGAERWVMAPFDLNDFLEIYRLESLFYEYWRTMATLRTIGKGVTGIWSDDVNWFTYDDGVPGELFDLYDSRGFSNSGFQTLFGTWHPQKKRTDEGLFFAWAQYNSLNLYNNKTGVVENFEVGLESLSHFWEANSFLAGPFLEKHGVRLDALMYLLCALSASATIPVRLIGADSDQERVADAFRANQLNLNFRAYVIRTSPKETVIAEALALATALDAKAGSPSADDIELALEFLTYSSEKINTVSLWAGGRKYPLFMFGENIVFDLAAVTDWLEGLFFGVRDQDGLKGFRFEDIFRSHLEKQEINIVHHGEIVWDDESVREADAIVRIGDVAVVMECVAAERPVDFEIAEPRRFARRKEILRDKAEQARSLCVKLRETPRARNLNLDWASEIKWIVVSHLSEFPWTKNFPCFEDGRECILHPAAVEDWLAELAKSELEKRQR